VFCRAMAAALFLGVIALAQDLPSGVEKKTILAGNGQQTYYLYIPEDGGSSAPMPLLVLMHGAGGSGLDQVTAWLPVAERNHVILIAPNIKNSVPDWDQLYDHPEWIQAAIEQVSRAHRVNNRRMYLWGYSAGGMFAFYFAFLESRYFAAAAVHGGVIENFKYQMADFATRKIPFAYYIGTKDQWWSVYQARASRDALTSRAFPVHYVELKGADHNFFKRREEITNDAWNFLQQFSLDAEPRFDALDTMKIKAALK
jgi:poly(3-hydroxybutyrate) depolymerase